MQHPKMTTVSIQIDSRLLDSLETWATFHFSSCSTVDQAVVKALQAFFVGTDLKLATSPLAGHHGHSAVATAQEVLRSQ